MTNQIKLEKLDILTGDRGSRGQMAVRLDDLTPILRGARKLKATKVNAAPTAAQYNALLDDLKNITDMLEQVAKSIQEKLVR